MKVVRVRILVLIASACAAALTGCPGPGDGIITDLSLSELGRVYTAGYSETVVRARYWVDAQPRDIAEADQGIGTKATNVVPTNLGDYVVGTRTDFVDPVFLERAIVWFNGRGEFLDTAPSLALSAVLHDGGIVAGGRRDPDGGGWQPCLWEIRDTWTAAGASWAVASRSITRHDLMAAESGYGEVRDVTASGADLYACGSYGDGGVSGACYWKNGARTDLAGGVLAETIRVYGGSVYVGGKTATGACFWIDGTRTDLGGFPAGSSDHIVTAVTVGESGVLWGGSYYKDDYRGFLWDGSLMDGQPRVIGLGASGPDYYIGGPDGWIKNADNTPLEWVDGNRPAGIRMRFY